MTPQNSYHVRSLKKAQKLLAQLGLDALLVADLADIRRLTGFTGSSGVLVVFEDGAVFVTDPRYTLQAAEEVVEVELVTAGVPDNKAAQLLFDRKTGYLGMEASSVLADRWFRFKRMLAGIEIVNLGGKLSRQRMVKDPEEIGLIARASRIAEQSLKSVLEMVRPGNTEREVALEFRLNALKLGAEALAFDTIVAAGARGALPHAVPSDNAFTEGDLVVFDFGVKVGGYCSDQTVTLSVGDISKEAQEVYQTVLAAQKAAISQVKAGVKLKKIDAAARNEIKSKGYGNRFGHGTGHGLGLNVHEAPVVGPRSNQLVEKNMVFTIEPGIYLPGRFGVRLEDVVVVDDDGCSLLTTLSKELGGLTVG